MLDTLIQMYTSSTVATRHHNVLYKAALFYLVEVHSIQSGVLTPIYTVYTKLCIGLLPVSVCLMYLCKELQ